MLAMPGQEEEEEDEDEDEEAKMDNSSPQLLLTSASGSCCSRTVDSFSLHCVLWGRERESIGAYTFDTVVSPPVLLFNLLLLGSSSHHTFNQTAEIGI